MSNYYFLLGFQSCGYETEEIFKVDILLINLYSKSHLVLLKILVRNLYYFPVLIVQDLGTLPFLFSW